MVANWTPIPSNYYAARGRGRRKGAEICKESQAPAGPVPDLHCPCVVSPEKLTHPCRDGQGFHLRLHRLILRPERTQTKPLTQGRDTEAWKGKAAYPNDTPSPQTEVSHTGFLEAGFHHSDFQKQSSFGCANAEAIGRQAPGTHTQPMRESAAATHQFRRQSAGCQCFCLNVELAR